MGRTRFAVLMAGDPESVPLDEATLLIAARLQPGLDLIDGLAALDMLAAECPTPTADGVARYLFNVEHFRGNRGSYYDWRNSCIDQVIATRTGIPISLSVVMIEVAQRVGVPLVGIGMPAHFLVRAADDEQLFFDPFDQGRRLDRQGAKAMFDAVTNGQMRWRDEYLDPVSARSIIVRILNNLKGVFTARRDLVRLGVVMKLRGEVEELAAEEESEIVSATAMFN